jgi:hypothetical protein
MQIGVEHGDFLFPRIGVLFPNADHRPERLDVESVPLRLRIDLPNVGGERGLLFLQSHDASDNSAKLVPG